MATLLALIAFLVFSSIILCFAWLFLAILRGCFRVLYKGNSFTGISAQNMALGLGLTALIFNDSINFFIRAIFRLISASFAMFSNSAAQLLARSEMEPERWLPALAEAIRFESATLIRTFEQLVASAPFAQIFVMAAFCLLVCLILQGNGASTKGIAVLNWLSSWTPAHRRKALFWAALGAGTYLSLAAIIAIPWIQGINDKDPSETTELRNRLRVAMLSEDLGGNLSVPVVQDQTYSKINELIASTQAKISNKPNSEAAEAIKSETSGQNIDVNDSGTHLEGERRATVYRNLVFDLQQAKRDLDTLPNKWSSAIVRLENHQKVLQENALNTFDNYADTDLSRREREQWASDLLRWYRSSLTQISWDFSDLHRSLKFQLRDIERWLRYVEETLTTSNRRQLHFPSAPSSIRDHEFQTANVYDNQIPPTPREDTGLGAFAFFAQWLVSSRSLSLALISGMIGFGLFGSVMGRAFLPAHDEQGKPLDSWSGDVLLVGFSAAVIIFLASQGGMAVIASGNTELNPHVLFLACFVGAAFGDRVWNRAKVQLLEKLNEQGHVEEKPNPTVDKQ